jgi:hypothetical protein
MDPLELSFLNDEYKIRPLLEGDPPCIEGKFYIIGNKILLKYNNVSYESTYYIFDAIFKEDWELEYTIINDSLYFSEGLIGKGIIFGRNDSKPKDGEIRIINGNEIIIQRNEGGIRLKSDVKVRIGPGVNFQYCIFELYSEDAWYVVTSTVDYLPEGYWVDKIGHSKNIDTDDGLTGYWYYCFIPVYPDAGGKIIKPSEVIKNSGWIFGPLID